MGKNSLLWLKNLLFNNLDLQMLFFLKSILLLKSEDKFY